MQVVNVHDGGGVAMDRSAWAAFLGIMRIATPREEEEGQWDDIPAASNVLVWRGKRPSSYVERGDTIPYSPSSLRVDNGVHEGLVPNQKRL